ncbi:HEAT repeat domain-containing protein [Georgenia sp. TF02-10]|uniref:HEAT repeat domain-containing protein n=1 Tax=Georgenia sp. TF02-10 TaxID=2917725 RepID=UPI001FA6E9C8|nr:HEAT repeat domain-containing protein [Georgenia sp. TF02-10]UNX54514.1 HEAT repeat domain-containing protein [Georgenia sp. TF02-10]
MSAAPPFVIKADRIFDGTGVLAATHLRVDRGLVEAIGGEEIIQPGDEVTDGGGGTLLPGLIDAHVHLAPECTVLAAQFGVTTLVDQFSKPDVIAAERAAVLTARRGDGPARADFVTSSIGATAPGGHPTMAYSPFPYVTGPGDAEPFVAGRMAEGATHLKVIYDDGSGAMLHIPALDEATILALVQSAHNAGLSVVAHVSTGEGAALVARCGVDMLGHVPFAPMSQAQLDEVAAAGLAVIATLSISDGFPVRAGVMPLREDVLLDTRLTPAWREVLDTQAQRWMPPTGPDLDAALANVRELARRGCAILAGTDAPNPGLVYGASLHRELHHLAVAAGLGPAVALRAATSVPARLFGLHDRGLLSPGKRADLLLVDGNPLDAIADTARVRHTWVEGSAVDPAGYVGGPSESATIAWLSDSQTKILAAIKEMWPELAAAAGLGEPIEPTGDPQVDDALHRLMNPDRDVRQAAALDLGTLADPGAARALVARLWSEPDFFVRDTLSWAVTRVAEAAAPLLLDALAGADTASRVQAVHVLSKIADPATTDAIVPLAADDDPDVAAKARWALTRIGDPRAIPALAAQLGTGDSNGRNGLTRDLASFGRAAVPCLVTALTSDEAPMRRHAAEVLCFIGTGAEGATEALTEALQDTDEQVRLSAAMALYELRTPTAQAVLARQTEADDPRLRAIANRAQSRTARTR